MPERQPNILFILTDDLGWRDLGCTGSTFYETPHLDRLCREGVRFTNAYATCPVCSPSRASILTGRYPARLGITNWIDWTGTQHPRRGKLIDAPYLRELPQSEKTVAQTLRDSGYATWHVGKWHLGGEGHYPTDFGFEVNCAGNEWGMPMQGYFSPYGMKALEDGPDGEFLTDRLTDEALELLRQRDGRPFYLNLCYYAVHIPIQAKEEDIEHFRRKAARLGLDKLNPMVEGEPFPVLRMRNQHVVRRMFQSDPVYAALIYRMDQNIGRILDELTRQGELENTVVVFTSDNGGLATAQGSPTCNLPASQGKGWCYEGGVRVPIVVWSKDHARPGMVCDTPVTGTDFYPTLLELAGVAPRSEQHIDGVSLAPLLQGGQIAREALFWHYPHYGGQGGTPACAIRMGDYKLIEFFEDNHVELYNLRTDIGECSDLTREMPALADEMLRRLHRWQEELESQVPLGNPEYA